MNNKDFKEVGSSMERKAGEGGEGSDGGGISMIGSSRGDMLRKSQRRRRGMVRRGRRMGRREAVMKVKVRRLAVKEVEVRREEAREEEVRRLVNLVCGTSKFLYF